MVKFYATVSTFLFVVLFSTASHAQSLQWLNHYGSSGEDRIYHLDSDPLGNAYVSGRYSGSLDFDPGPGVAHLDTNTTFGYFIAKYDPAGALIWVKQFPTHITSMVCNPSGNGVTLGGSFFGTIDFDPGVGVVNRTASAGTDLYLVRLDANGNYVNDFSVEGISGETFLDLAVDQNNDIIITFFSSSDTLDLDPGAGQVLLFGLGFGTNWTLVAKYDSLGAYQWYNDLPANDPFGAFDGKPKVRVDNSGNVLIAGAKDFYPPYTIVSSSNFYLQKFTPAGVSVWLKTIPSGSATDLVYDIDVDPSGNFYMTGATNFPFDLDPGPGVTTIGTGVSGAINASFLAKFDVNGDYQWGFQVGAPYQPSGSFTSCLVNSISADGNEIGLTGVFRDQVDFDPGSGLAITQATTLDEGFVLRVDASGNYIWSGQESGSFIDNLIQTDQQGSFFFGASLLSGSADADPTAGVDSIHSQGQKDYFLGRLDPCVPLNIGITISDSMVCLGDSISLTASGGTQYAWSGGIQNGQLFLPTSSQTYVVTITDSLGCTGVDSITVTVTQPVAITFPAQFFCPGDSVFLAGAFRTEAGIYFETLPNPNGCDTVLIYSLVAHPSPVVNLGADTNFCADSLVLDPGSQFVSYLWQDSSTSQTFTVTTAGTYYVQVTGLNGCMAIDTIVITKDSCIAQTALQSQFCGTTVSSLSQTLFCDPVFGATEYRWEFTEGANVLTRIRTNGFTNMQLGWVNGIQYGSTYQVRVQAKVNGVWGFYGSSCPISTPTFAGTQVQSSYCGTTISSFSQTIFCDPIVGATAYEWRFINGTDTLYRIRSNGATNMQGAWVNGLQYGLTYQVAVQPQIAGVWLGYGTSCALTFASLPGTQVQTSDCGTTVSSLTQNIYCDPISGASEYEWRFVNGGTTLTRIRTNGFTNMQLVWVNGLQYGTTYQVSVRARVSGVWGNFGTACAISTPTFTATQVQSSFCGTTVSSLNQNLICDPITGATSYRWRFINGTDTLYRIRTNGFTNMQPAWVNGIQYGLTYQVAVQALIGGVWSSYGSDCAITMPTFPSTQVQSSFCGTTLSSINAIILNDAVPGADRYQWRFVNGSNTYFITRTNGGLNISPGWINGIQNGLTYQVSVQSRVGGVWSGFGSACAITIPAAVTRLAVEDGVEETEIREDGLSLSIYPNPNSGDNLWLRWNGSEDEPVAIRLMDITGKTLLIKNASYQGQDQDYHLQLPVGLAKGYYLVQLSQGDEQVTKKLIIR